MLSRGDKVLVLESGRFATAWGDAAKMLGAEVEVLRGDFRRAVRPDAVEARLKADAKGEIKAILVAQIDTASGVVNDIKAIGEAMRAAGHDALLMVDTVASLGCMPFEMDAWGVDVAMAGSQKGLMTPPGFGFTAASPRARDVHQKAGMRTPYWDWTFREGSVHYHKYCGTPPEQSCSRCARPSTCCSPKASRTCSRATARWPKRRAARSPSGRRGRRSLQHRGAVRTLQHGDGGGDARGESAQPLVDYCAKQCGVVLGRALGDIEGKGFRIAHMGHVNAPMVLGTLGVIEMGLSALGIPHGKGGSAAAIEYLAEARRGVRRIARPATQRRLSPVPPPCHPAAVSGETTRSFS